MADNFFPLPDPSKDLDKLRFPASSFPLGGPSSIINTQDVTNTIITSSQNIVQNAQRLR